MGGFKRRKYKIRVLVLSKVISDLKAPKLIRTTVGLILWLQWSWHVVQARIFTAKYEQIIGSQVRLGHHFGLTFGRQDRIRRF
jgi:hypothetical protein